MASPLLKGKKYTVRIDKDHNNKKLQKPILFIGECFRTNNSISEFIDTTTFNVHVVPKYAYDCCIPAKTGGTRKRKK